jgi:fluoride ion exporter CrcB/FEX
MIYPEGKQTVDIQTYPEDKNSAKRWEDAVLFCAIGLMCIVGAYIRTSAQYFVIWPIETAVNYQYFNILGSFIMGVMLRHKHALHENGEAPHKILYISIASGLCGSITSFSTLQIEGNKSFFLQWDFTWGNINASYNGGKFLQWMVCLLEGVATPLIALHVGQLAGGLSPLASAESCAPLSPVTQRRLAWVTVGTFVVSVLVIAIVCFGFKQQQSHLGFVAIFGVLGGYLRYRLSFLNEKRKEFPLGTFIANIGGTWLFAIILVISKFAVEYHDYAGQAALFGVTAGFCGCLTTISTFVAELDNLPQKSGYVYGTVSTLVAQAGIILLYNAYAYSTIPLSDVYPHSINACERSYQLCGEFLSKANCTPQYVVNAPCSDMNDYSTYDSSQCQCLNFASDRFSELIVDSQVKNNVASHSVAVWPNKPSAFEDASQTYDVCMAHEVACRGLFERMGCPHNLRHVNSCNRQGLFRGEWTCTCGGFDTPGDRIQELITDAYLAARYDLTPYNGYTTMDSIDFPAAYESVCSNMLDHADCPEGERSIVSTLVPGDYSTWAGTCECGDKYDVNTVRVSEDIYDAVMRPWALSLLVRPNPAVHVWDMCSSYLNLCNYWLDKIQCPTGLRDVNACSSADPSIDGTIMAYEGRCVCGSFEDLTDRPLEWVIDSLVAETMWREFWYIQQPHAVYTTAMSSSASKPFYH